ncbi:RecF protein [Treponema primitia ZAS-2]|uniref:DNA replication and repair protein RecF n=1 Tax=Treponema primitia (strain ATCC BAA-887 / DSM 12427 / ZAS-2) TaxID=545694 RepID=F5YLH3_TREPZ|nr:DNA replication and repair protein RecF [Treponema primitia]AEF86544.1 RecF protein [Treponema primitia ZAS-2]
MPFETLRTAAFRNLEDIEVDVRGKDIFLVGENGQGKTNFLEALYFCSYAASFRGVRDNEVVCTGEKDFSAAVKLSGSLYNRILVKFEKGKKSVTIDGKPLEDRKDLLEISPCIVFCHEDMEFVAGAPERRRWFFDQCLSLYDPVYLDDLRRYRKILKTRNAVLREAQGNANRSQVYSVLDALDSQMAVYGLRLMEKREEAAKLFSETFGPLYETVAEIEGIEVRYTPSWNRKTAGLESLTAYLEERRDMDLSAGLCLSGPHRDRYGFTCAGADFSAKASTGQRRLLALLLRIAQARRFSEMTGRNPVLLLDDVLLELDPEKRRRLLSVMPGYDQAFYTFLPEEPYERYRKSDTLVYYMQGGRASARGDA